MVRKNTHKLENVPLFHINKYHKRQECVGECIQMQENWKDKHKNILCEISYVVSVHMTGEMLKDQKVWDNTGLMENKITCFCIFCMNNPIKEIKC